MKVRRIQFITSLYLEKKNNNPLSAAGNRSISLWKYSPGDCRGEKNPCIVTGSGEDFARRPPRLTGVGHQSAQVAAADADELRPLRDADLQREGDGAVLLPLVPSASARRVHDVDDPHPRVCRRDTRPHAR